VLPSSIDGWDRWGTTLTDARSQRSRTGRRGGQRPTQARSRPCENGVPTRVPRRPCFRTVAPFCTVTAAREAEQHAGIRVIPYRVRAPPKGSTTQVRNVSKAHGNFPSDTQCRKILYLGFCDIETATKPRGGSKKSITSPASPTTVDSRSLFGLAVPRSNNQPEHPLHS
jgi:hypothetical protein